ncbi:DUF2059 domain-containing protein [Pseudorhodoplanes sp.]|uniref:DUF2059 domain-containing protein n=1 Tax=Pseudorhodoplanes sp. TaxID=1934341 RepID=UPI002BD0762E|nr:DUF2059 domain-containing protein [Pseudorhodoplanes sp.]HWV51793.1 DUF2059 domain-containing protein [Pseudorhodoplanes sp.]
MNVDRMVAGLARGMMVAVALTMLSVPASAQQQPSAAAMASAREIVEVKGAMNLFNPVVAGVVEKIKLTFLQSNPNLQKDLDSVAHALRAEYAPRAVEIRDQLARLYAQHFNEQELKDILTFYKSPLGKKMNEEEPKLVDQSMVFVEGWAEKLSEEVLGKFRAEMKKKGHDL